MNKKIKFRALDKIDKKLRQVISINFSTKEVSLLNEYTNESYIRSFDKVELMQYTGQKDIIGKEIYEGDIAEIILEYPECHESYNDETQNYTGEIYFDNGYKIKTKEYHPSITHYYKKSLKVIDNLNS